MPGTPCHTRDVTTPPPSLDAQRLYRGLGPDERRARRREQLIEAAIAAYAERGFRNATVKIICEAAGLTERYFYESFTNREDLLIASFNEVNDRLFEQITRAALSAGGAPLSRARAILQAYFQALQAQPDSARVFLLEIRGVSDAVDAAFDQVLEQIGMATTALALASGSPTPGPMLQAGVVGGITHIATRWIRNGYQPGLEEVVDAALELAQILGRPARIGGEPSA